MANELNTNPLQTIQPPMQEATEQEQPLLPSTEENQLATEEASEAAALQADAFERKRKEIEANKQRLRQTGELTGELQQQAQQDDIDSVLTALESEKQEEQEAEAAAKTDEEKQIIQRQAQLERAAKLGITLPEQPIDAVIKQRALDGVELEDDQKQAALESPTEQQVEQEAQTIRQQNAVNQAVQDEAARKSLEDEQKLARAEAEVLKEDEQLNTIDANRFWKNQSTWDKIRLTLGAAFLAGAGKSEVALNHINNLVDRDIQEQRLNIKNSLAKKEQAMKMSRLELERTAQKTNNALKKTQLAKLIQEMGAQEQQIRQQRIMAKQLESGDINPSLLDKDQRDRIIRTPEGKIRLADNKEAAKELRKFKGEVEPAIKGAQRILALSRQGSKFNPFDRAKVATELQALVGQLRIPFTGPGAMTIEEYNRILNTLGDPNKLFSLPDFERTKLETVIGKLRVDLSERYKSAGINNIKLNKRKKLMSIMKANKPKLSEEAISAQINKMIEEGRISTDYIF